MTAHGVGVRGSATMVLAMAALLSLAGCAGEGVYPDREIRIIVHAAPGGISDSVSRYIARELQEQLGVPVVCENRVGAAGSIALSYVARSEPDGYTVGYAPVEMTIIPHLGFSQVTPDDFDYLILHTRAPACLAVPSTAPWQTLEDFVQAARQSPGRINMATSGTGSIWHLASLALSQQAALQLNYVPFPGSAQAVTALLGGHVDAVVAGPSEVQAHVEAGNLRLLGVMSDERSPIFPDLPTFGEQGYDIEIEAWGGFVAPKGLPPDRQKKLIDAMQTVLQSEDARRFCAERGLEIDLMSGQAFAAFVQEEYRQFSALVKQAGL